MARSPAHKFGQIIGEMLEQAVKPVLGNVAHKFSLYLDWKHPRKARKGHRKLSWTDHRGNQHDLDFVLEAGGTETGIGRPKAFIEIAYRRYTRHSRNKAHEIQGAIAPLVETFSDDHPFLGVILGGEFTSGAITQLKSHGFGLLYFPFNDIVEAFKTQGIDAWFGEDSADTEVRKKVRAYEALSRARKAAIPAALRERKSSELERFIAALEESLGRRVTTVTVLALHGPSCQVQAIQDAIAFITGYQECGAVNGFVRYEVTVRYSNGDDVRGQFRSKAEAVKFLKGLL